MCTAMKSKQRDSLLHGGVILYNSLPACIRSITGDLELFKTQLDELLSLLPDQPPVPGFIPDARDIKGNPSNSIVDWLRITDIANIFPSNFDVDMN